MTEHTLDTLTQRLDRVERENRRLKRLAGLALLGILAIVVMGQARTPRLPEAIEAKSFVVRDASGKQRAWFGLGSGALALAGLKLFDTTGRVRAAFAIGADGKTTVELLDDSGIERLLLFLRQNGRAGLILKDGTDSGRVALSLSESGIPVFGLTAGRGNPTRFMVTTAGDVVTVSLLDEREKTLLTLGGSANTPLILAFDQDGKVIWKAP